MKKNGIMGAVKKFIGKDKKCESFDVYLNPYHGITDKGQLIAKMKHDIVEFQNDRKLGDEFFNLQMRQWMNHIDDEELLSIAKMTLNASIESQERFNSRMQEIGIRLGFVKTEAE